MKRFLPAVLLVAALPLIAGEHAVRGPESLLGPVDLASISASADTRAVMASDGDEVVVAWMGRGALYAQRLDRNGAVLSPLPRLLRRGVSWQQLGIVYAGGFYS